MGLLSPPLFAEYAKVVAWVNHTARAALPVFEVLPFYLTAQLCSRCSVPGVCSDGFLASVNIYSEGGVKWWKRAMSKGGKYDTSLFSSAIRGSNLLSVYSKAQRSSIKRLRLFTISWL